MEKLTKQEAVGMHRHMWNWIADETERTGEFIDKFDYFDAMNISDGDRPDSLCYCCEYTMRQNGGEYVGRCRYCPLDWGSKCDEFMCSQEEKAYDEKGLFARWATTNSIEESIELARKIANLIVKVYMWGL